MDNLLMKNKEMDSGYKSRMLSNDRYTGGLQSTAAVQPYIKYRKHNYGFRNRLNIILNQNAMMLHYHHIVSIGLTPQFMGINAPR